MEWIKGEKRKRGQENKRRGESGGGGAARGEAEGVRDKWRKPDRCRRDRLLHRELRGGDGGGRRLLLPRSTVGVQLLELCGGPREAVCVLRQRSLDVLGTLPDGLRSRGVACELAGTDDVGVDPQPRAGLHKRV